MHLHSMPKSIFFAVAIACAGAGTAACSSDDTGESKPSGSSGTSGSPGTSSGSSGSGGACTGEITSCAVGTLSDTQTSDMCSLLLAAIDSPAGTKFECKEGPQEGVFITVNTKEQCVAQRPPATCKATVGQLVDCYKSLKKDACAAVASTGACSPLFDPESGCSS